MGVTEDKLLYLAETKRQIREAIESKGIAVTDGDTFRDYAVKIHAIDTGRDYGNPDYDDPVRFFDYDGTLLYSYTVNEFLALSFMPALPTCSGLICQEWNYSLSAAQQYVAEYGKLDIGATYITDDGKTRLYIEYAAKPISALSLYFKQSSSNCVTIDWGDGSAPETLEGANVYVTATHDYAEKGNYCVTLDVLDGSWVILGYTSSSSAYYPLIASSAPYKNALKKVEIGKGVIELNCAFRGCHSLSSVTIPSGVTAINTYAFQYCQSLSSVTIPSGVTAINTYAFCNCYSLSSVTIPSGVTAIGNYAFQYCQSLSSVTIPSGVTAINTYAFQNCQSVSSVTIPSSVTAIGNYAFQYCYSLSSVTIPSGVTVINTYAFSHCQSFSSVTIPSGVTAINTYAFQNCQSVMLYDFSNHSAIPSLTNTNAFSNIDGDCRIIVPDALYNSWIAATNWSNSNIVNKIVKASEYNR